MRPPLLGENTHRLPGSRAAFLACVAEALRARAGEHGVDLPALDRRAVRDVAGSLARCRHVAPRQAGSGAASTALYDDLVARLLAAGHGRAFNCLALDLDNTVWGGAVGDDGLEGVALGQGSTLGEVLRAAATDLPSYLRSW